MRYLIVDPIGDYAGRLKAFLDRLGLPAIAVFTSAVRHAKWQNKWHRILGDHVVGVYGVDAYDDEGDGAEVEQLADEIRADHGDAFYGIVPWDELHTVFAADLSDRLDLGWNSKAVVERCRDKFVMKRWLRQVARERAERGESSPRINLSAVVTNATEAEAFQEKVGRWPIVVKPAAAAGAMGVTFAGSPGELLRGCQQVMDEGLGKVLLEEYVGGPEFAVNGLVDSAGDFMPTDIWSYDKRDSHGQRNLYYQSVKLSTHEAPFWDLARYAADVVSALGVVRTPVHMEVKIDDRGPCLIEVGARFAGGDQPVLASKLHHHDLFELAACHYLQDLPADPNDVDYRHYDHYEARILSGIQSHAVAPVRAVHGVEEVKSLPSFAGFGFVWPPGTRVPVTRDLNTKSWEVYVMHPDPRQIEIDAQRVRRLLRYE